MADNEVTYEIWSEGEQVGERSKKPYFHGYSRGRTFEEACKRFFRNHASYNAEYNCVWGCNLYETKEEAEK